MLGDTAQSDAYGPRGELQKRGEQDDERQT
jgi:hypothetical protein